MGSFLSTTPLEAILECLHDTIDKMLRCKPWRAEQNFTAPLFLENIQSTSRHFCTPHIVDLNQSLTHSTVLNSTPKMVTFLDLPFEIREQIYTDLLTLPSSCDPTNPATAKTATTTTVISSPTTNGRLLHPAILSTCHQIHSEALPILYTKNTFQCHPKLLTSFPRLHHPSPAHKQLTETSCPGVKLIRRWYLHARLDCGPFWDADTVAKALTGAEELELEVWQSMFRADGTELSAVLRMFEGVRGVRRVRVWGSTTGVEGYVAWLEGAMRSHVGSAVEPYLGEDERLG